MPRRSTVPTGVAVFNQDVAIRRYSDATNTIVHWSDFSEGGHFAALETSELCWPTTSGYSSARCDDRPSAEPARAESRAARPPTSYTALGVPSRGCAGMARRIAGAGAHFAVFRLVESA